LSPFRSAKTSDGGKANPVEQLFKKYDVSNNGADYINDL